MNRRGFFRIFGLGVAAVAVTPVIAKAASTFVSLAPSKDYSTYILGDDAVLSNEKNGFQANGAEIPGWVSYRYHYTVTLPPNANRRIRFIDTTDAIK